MNLEESKILSFAQHIFFILTLVLSGLTVSLALVDPRTTRSTRSTKPLDLFIGSCQKKCDPAVGSKNNCSLGNIAKSIENQSLMLALSPEDTSCINEIEALAKTPQSTQSLGDLGCGLKKNTQFARKLGGCTKNKKRAGGSCKNMNKCIAQLRKAECNSPWADLTLIERYERILELGKPHAEKYKVDVRVFPCIAARETTTLDPFSVTFATCNFISSGTGEGHIINNTLDDLTNRSNIKFRSSIPPFGQAPFIKDVPILKKNGQPAHDRRGNALFRKDISLLMEAVPTSVPLQLEIMAQTLHIKRYYISKKSGERKRRSDISAWGKYYGNPDKSKNKKYGIAINNCYRCLEKGDTPISCLNKAAQRSANSPISLDHEYAWVQRKYCKK